MSGESLAWIFFTFLEVEPRGRRAKSTTAGPTAAPSLCARDWSSNQIAAQKKKKKKKASLDSVPFAQKQGENIWKSWQQPRYFCHWRTPAGGGRTAEGFVNCAGKKGNSTPCEETSPERKPHLKPFFAALLGHYLTKGGFPVTIPTYPTRQDDISYWRQATKAAYHDTQLGPRLMLIWISNSPCLCLTLVLQHHSLHNCFPPSSFLPSLPGVRNLRVASCTHGHKTANDQKGVCWVHMCVPIGRSTHFKGAAHSAHTPKKFLTSPLMAT